MYLKSITLSGFKSFAKKSDLEFDAPISAIVGPNGSGKSNVAEAFRFVLGEQSIKSMRGKRGEDLIWNGSTNEPRSSRAAVKVSFDNSKKVFDLDFSEVTIERVVYRDGENEYLINGSKVRLKDIIELLAKAGLGASGHHIISQGEADRILSANPKERKAMVEDALGLRLYQYKRQESEKKLNKTFENIAQVQALRKEIAPHLRFLEKQVEKVEKAENMREELLEKAREYFKREEIYIEFHDKHLKKEREPLEKELLKLARESSDAKRVLELESGLALVQKERDECTRELGKIEALIGAEENVIKQEEKLALSDELKTIRLKEVEDLYQEVSIFSEVEKIIERLKSFIQERKHYKDSRSIEAAQEKIKEYKKRQSELEAKVLKAREKEKEISEAEISIFRLKSLENELISKLNLLKSREENSALLKEELRRELVEVGHLVGTALLGSKEFSIEPEEALVEERDKQEERKRVISKLKIRLEDSGFSGLEEVAKEYKETKDRDTFLERELGDLETSAKSLEELIGDLEERLATEFSLGIKKINQEFDKLFTTMFGGGEAALTLTEEKKRDVDELEEGSEDLETSDAKTEEGLEIKINIPRKKIKSLVMLSGGERALTSIALIFAISQVNPPPFVILDETDAALDESNSKKYGDLVETLSNKSQLILITHNRETMSRAGVIYGVTMGANGVSKLLSISFDAAVAVAK